MSDYWLKSLGVSDDRMPDDWSKVGDGLFLKAATFAQKPGLRNGDGIIFYATGTGLIFAGGEVTSYPYEQAGDTRWTWRVNVEITRGARFIHDGVPLEHLNSPGRNQRVRIQRRSHVRLTEEEYEAGMAALPGLVLG